MESILKREDGKQYKITVILSKNFSGYFTWEYSVFYREKGKKNWLTVPHELHDYQLRQLSMQDRKKSINKNYLRFVSESEIIEVMKKYLETIKPSL